MGPHGDIADAGWAQARLNDGSNVSSRSFSYPATAQPVRLYLIDTAVKQTKAWGTWFKRNPKLTIKENNRINSGASAAFEHGTKLLSIIAGPETGVALGTPIEVVIYDVYMGNETTQKTDSGSISVALQQARIHHLTAATRLPGVICLASGSLQAAQSAGMEDSINQVLSAGLTVVVSAGNSNQDASAYVPSAYGTKPGVICVGASSISNQKFASSNYGPAVDLFAPGEDVRTLNYDAPKTGVYELMDGTSPACALTAAAALVELSKNPSLTPAQVEENLRAQAYAGAAPAPLVQVVAQPEVDSDGDGVTDVMESFFATNSSDPAVRPARPAVSQADGQISISFDMAASLFNAANPFLLNNGGTWSVQYSEDLVIWENVEGTPVAGTAVDGKLPVSFSLPATAPSGYLRVDVSMPATSN
ncbi:S8 family serine peptidase [Haloferula sp. BvORR071]|uniref:S8 family serine peptidase n=1 Tax=Haloferula sp. BvORR071 TaxID=1396141 RepID=UPI000697D510|nr:S8 family serine peptidase [Haloferula sp. BvORR071]